MVNLKLSDEGRIHDGKTFKGIKRDNNENPKVFCDWLLIIHLCYANKHLIVSHYTAQKFYILIFLFLLNDGISGLQLKRKYPSVTSSLSIKQS